MKREYWMDRDGMGIPPKKTAVSVVDIGTEGLKADIKAEHGDTLEQAVAKLCDACGDFREVSMRTLGIDRVIRFLIKDKG